MEAPTYRCWTKATDAETGPPRYSANWIASRRAWFSVFSDRVECGDWVIRRSDVRDAVLYRSRTLLLPVHVLSVVTEKQTFQFGFNPWVRLRGRLPFDVREERVAMRYSAFSLAVRGGLLGYAVYLAVRWVSQ